MIHDATTVVACVKSGSHHPLSPLELTDLIGLGTCSSTLEMLALETGSHKYQPAPLLRNDVWGGNLGLKNANGFYPNKRRHV